MILDVVKVFAPAAVAFFAGVLLALFLTRYFYKYKMWKRTTRNYEENTLSDEFKELHKKLHENNAETKTPRVGGIIIWLSALIVIFLYWLIAKFFPNEITKKLTFLSRSQTWLPLFTLVTASLVGLADDFLQIFGRGEKLKEGLSLKKRILFVVAISAAGAWWFFAKLGVSSIMIPFFGELVLGWLFIPLFMATMVFVFAGGVIDGIDGLAGGVMAFAFLAYMGIAFFQNQIDLAAFCALVTGGILAFLWFNIPPARFYMGETGILGLTTTLVVVAFLTGAVAVLPIIAFPLFITTISDIIQVFSKKYFGKKVFKVAPIHHHFQAIGWPSEKVTMRFWIISIIFAIIGMVLALF
jgi:phospho-N-acetylmuramoyl-pentapeptide-transferase